MCRRGLRASQRAKVLTLREGGEEVRPRADRQAKKPITDSKREVGGRMEGGSGRALTFQLSRLLGGWLWEGGREGGRLAAAQRSLIQAHHSPPSISGRR